MSENEAGKFNWGVLVRAAIFAGKFVLAGGIISWLIWENHHQFVSCLSTTRSIWIALASLLMLLQLAVCAVRWRVLLDSQGVWISFWDAFSLTVQSCFFSLVIPGGAAGGDVVKASLVASRTPQGKRLAGAFSILVDRLVGLLGLFIMVVFCAIFTAGDIARLASATKAVFMFLIGISVVGILCALIFPFHERILAIKPIKALLDYADGLMKGMPGRMIEAAGLYQEQWRSVVKAIALSVFISNPLMIAMTYILVIGISGVAANVWTVSMASLFSGVAGAIPITPGGVGTRDAVCKAGLAVGGVDAGAAVAAPLLYTTIFIGISLLGGLLFAFDSVFKSVAAKGNAVKESVGADVADE